jgi:hypothetical protein
MQVTFQPLQILSRVVAVCLVALSVAFVLGLAEEQERETIGKLNQQQLIAYIKEGHASSFLAGYLQVAVVTLIFVLVVEAVAFGFRFLIGALATKRPVPVPDEELVAA